MEKHLCFWVGSVLPRLSSPPRLGGVGSPAGYVVPLGLRLLWPHPRLLHPPAALFSSSSGSLPYGLIWAGYKSFPNLLRVSFPSCHLPYPARPSGCTRLFLHHWHWPSPSWHKLGICLPRTPVPTWVVSRGCKVRFMLRPEGLLALHRQGHLHSSFHLPSHL